jgi:iron-sulfur cluster repair protein YtfE (RIC family)
MDIPIKTPPQPAASAAPAAPAAIPVPKSVKAEHVAIRAALHEAERAPGAVGAAAKQLAEVLEPHMLREEEVALPPLSLLSGLMAGSILPATMLTDVQAMCAEFKRALPRMLEQHAEIRAALVKLHAASMDAGDGGHQELAERLARHIQIEEEVLYPGALAVGEIIRARHQG